MSDVLDNKIQELKNNLIATDDGEIIAATEKFLTDLSRAKKMELKAIETFNATLKTKAKNFGQPATS
jgi:hypothetical protein